MVDQLTALQLTAIGEVHALLEEQRVWHLMFGGWAVDFHAGRITRSHEDVDLAVWLDDVSRISRLLMSHGWRHVPEQDDDGGTGFMRKAVRLELTYLARAADGSVYIPLRNGKAAWSPDALVNELLDLAGARCRVMARAPLAISKSVPREGAEDAAKDRADYRSLNGSQRMSSCDRLRESG